MFVLAGGKMATGKFTDEMKAELNAVDGAYTSFTEEEVRKKTFNVKAAIRNLLEEYIGIENIPRVNVTKRQSIEFSICEKSKGDFHGKIEIQCKYSKPDKNEMSIYFLASHIQGFQIKPGDYWYVYFRKEDNSPYIGVFSKFLWENWFDIVDASQAFQQDGSDLEIQYKTPVEQLRIFEVDAPDTQVVPVTNNDSIINSLTPDQSALREKNKKILGNRGEEIAVEIEKRRLRDLGREDLIERIIPIGKKKDGLGYDVRSIDVDTENKTHDIYIEVKATSSGIDKPFEISRRELEISKRFKEYYYLYRIYNLKQNSSDVTFYKVKGALDENYNLEATGFRAYRKSNIEDQQN